MTSFMLRIDIQVQISPKLNAEHLQVENKRSKRIKH